MGNGKDCTEVEKQQKHLALDEAISALDSMTDKAYALLERVRCNDRGGITEGDENDVKDQPSLQAVLDDAPGRIYKKIDDMNGILSDLRSSIF